MSNMEKEHPLILSVRLKKLAIANNADPLILKKLDKIVAQRASEALEDGMNLQEEKLREEVKSAQRQSWKKPLMETKALRAENEKLKEALREFTSLSYYDRETTVWDLVIEKHKELLEQK